MRVLSITLLAFSLAHADTKRKNDEVEFITVKNLKGDIAFPDDLGTFPFARGNLMAPHYHHHQYHHHHHHHEEDMDGDGFESKEKGHEEIGTDQFANSSMQIPLDYIKSLNKYNVSDLLIHFVTGEIEEDTPSIQNRFGENDGEERSAARMPKGAECTPEFRTVKIAGSNDASILYIPQCTRIEQCGGCCKHELLSCQPSEIESIPFKVHKTQYTGEKKLKYLGTEVVTVEKHNKCKCLCRVQPKDCTKFQEYREAECRCVCRNHDERKKCVKYNETKLWNHELCTCQCRDSIDCSTGSYFDQNECRCLTVPVNRRAAVFHRRTYRSDDDLLSVVPLEEN